MIKWIAMFILLWFIYQVREVFPPIIVGGIIAYLLLPLVNHLSESAKIPVTTATLIVYLVFASVIGVTAWYLIPGLVREIADLASHQHDIAANLVKQIGEMTHWSGDVDAMADQLIGQIAESVKPAEIAHLGTTVSHGALSVLVCVVSSIYFTIDSARIGSFFLRYLPMERREEAVVLTGQMNRLLSKYVQGQLILIALMATVAWLFLNFIMHMRYALPVAILSGFLEIIPVLGPILAISTAVLVGIWQSGPQTAVWIVGFYTIARWIEDYIVVPKIIGHAVELHPLAVIFAVLCGEHLAGALGMLIAIPVAACIKLFIDFFYFGRQPEHPEDSTVRTPLVPPAPREVIEQNPVVQNLQASSSGSTTKAPLATAPLPSPDEQVMPSVQDEMLPTASGALLPSEDEEAQEEAEEQRIKPSHQGVKMP
jgi:predicted PurR-regulated permease PerM